MLPPDLATLAVGHGGVRNGSLQSSLGLGAVRGRSGRACRPRRRYACTQGWISFRKEKRPDLGVLARSNAAGSSKHIVVEIEGGFGHLRYDAEEDDESHSLGETSPPANPLVPVSTPAWPSFTAATQGRRTGHRDDCPESEQLRAIRSSYGIQLPVSERALAWLSGRWLSGRCRCRS